MKDNTNDNLDIFGMPPAIDMLDKSSDMDDEPIVYDVEWLVILKDDAAKASKEVLLHIAELSGRTSPYGINQRAEFIIASSGSFDADMEQARARGARILWDETGNSDNALFDTNELYRDEMDSRDMDYMFRPSFNRPIDDKYQNVMYNVLSYDIANKMMWNSYIPHEARDTELLFSNAHLYGDCINAITLGHTNVTLGHLADMVGIEDEYELEWRMIDYAAAVYAFTEAGLANASIKGLYDAWHDVTQCRKIWESNDKKIRLQRLLDKSWEEPSYLGEFAWENGIDCKIQSYFKGVPIEDIL